jgi:hypothetical protein
MNFLGSALTPTQAWVYVLAWPSGAFQSLEHLQLARTTRETEPRVGHSLLDSFQNISHRTRVVP